MVTQARGLNDIARADASPEEASEILLAVFTQPTPDLLDDTYLALRAWVWKALDQRRRDPELRAWSDILGAAASLMAQHARPPLSARIRTLKELIQESIAVGEKPEAIGTKQQRQLKARAFIAGKAGQADQSDAGAHPGVEHTKLASLPNKTTVSDGTSNAEPEDYYAAVERRAGGYLCAEAVGRLLGIRPRAVDARRRSGTLLALPKAGSWAYPWTQFHGDQTIPGLAEVIKGFKVSGSMVTLEFLVTPDDALSGLTPRDALVLETDDMRQRVMTLVRGLRDGEGFA